MSENHIDMLHQPRLASCAMSTLTNDGPTAVAARIAKRRVGLVGGLGLAATSAMAFSLSGSLARGLFDSGWSTGAVLIARTGIGALLLSPFALSALRHRWHVVRRSLTLIGAYAVFAVGGAQFAMADGSARYVSEGVDGAVYRAMSTRAGDETVQLP